MSNPPRSSRTYIAVKDPRDPHAVYVNPLVGRYSSPEMQRLFSPRVKHETWRKIWIELARAQRDLGLLIEHEDGTRGPITEAQIKELEASAKDIDFARAAQYEKEKRHDVMAHVATYRDQCPTAGGIIHLGATSCTVGDNTDLIVMRDALKLVHARLCAILRNVATFAAQHRARPTLGATHYQPAQMTTVGKRACLWAQDFLMDAHELEHRLDAMRFLGNKGTTGTQASFLSLFEGDHEKVAELDRRLAKAFGFRDSFPVTGQTYPRKLDQQVLDALGQVAASAHKFAADMRLLSHDREMEEPFEEKQVGSSAMPYKRNPMRSERTCALARYLMNLAKNGADTAANQWLERTLDDSANRRLSLGEGFLCADAILILVQNVTSGMVVHDAVIRARVERELPFQVTEEILMRAVRKGGDRQALHEAIRTHARAAFEQVAQGKDNDLITRLTSDPRFNTIRDDLPAILTADNPALIGRAPQQVDAFLADEVEPYLARHEAAAAGISADVVV